MLRKIARFLIGDKAIESISEVIVNRVIDELAKFAQSTETKIDDSLIAKIDRASVAKVVSDTLKTIL